jgi:ATP-dependent protease HslVU (ClpYQ) peptidase subunit
MSVVAVKVEKDKITIGADSIIVTGWTQEKDKMAKLNETNGMVIGDVGDAEEGGLFLMYCRTRKPREASVEGVIEFLSDFQDWKANKIDDSKIQNSYILVFEKKVFMMEGFYVKEVKDYMSIGMGMDYSLAALMLGHSVYEAINVACELSIYCEKPINIITIDK